MNLVKAIESSIINLHKEYREMCKLKHGDKRILLGRSFPMGNVFPYKLAKKMFSKSQYKVLVDCPIKIEGRSQRIYPDILILNEKNNTLRGIIDIKIDLGFLRLAYYGINKIPSKNKQTYTYSKNKNQFKRNYDLLAKRKKFIYTIKDDGEKEDREVKIQGKIEKIALVVTKQNDHGRADVYQKAVRDAGFKLVFVLDDSISHPNDIEKCKASDIRKNIREKSKELKRIFRNL